MEEEQKVNERGISTPIVSCLLPEKVFISKRDFNNVLGDFGEINEEDLKKQYNKHVGTHRATLLEEIEVTIDNQKYRKDIKTAVIDKINEVFNSLEEDVSFESVEAKNISDFYETLELRYDESVRLDT
jgi:hypothetical protein